MYCPKCGTPNDDNAFRCVSCQQIVQPVGQVASANMADDRMMRMLLPIGRSWWAIAAGYMGLFALLLLPAPLAILLGIVAVIDLKKHPHKYGMGRAVFALVTGTLGTAGLVWMLLSA